MTRPPITTKQQEILQLLYRFRFVNRIQIQAFLHHKDKRRSSRWLKDLREKQYIGWIYSTDFTEKTKPAIYYLGINGVRFLRSLNQYPVDELGKRYKEHLRKQTFIDSCLFTADCCVNLEQRSRNSSDLDYTYVAEADYADPDNYYHFLSDLSPDLCYKKQECINDKVITTNRLLEVFDSTTRHYKIKKRLSDYIAYLTSGEWEDETGDDKPPIVLIACPTQAELNYAKRLTRKLLENVVDDEDEDETIRIRFATTEQVNRQGVTGIIWKEP
jgi:hypothetical protein